MVPNAAAPKGEEAPHPHGDPGALALLQATRAHQRGLPREAAWAWERAAFAMAFLSPEPARRVQAFLQGER